ncbi:MAG: helix-turn-helix transcriptional regulator, partial [Armatimonadetes bacterium]|nr:helix-turn-helix transcriptional regulator [Armatimonadota bacterium]
REQILPATFRDTDLDIVRQFNVLLEKHFRRLHQVQDYAGLLHRSPKTLTNLFALYTEKSPLQMIHDRVCLEARRLLLYTDKPVREIAAHLGYDEVAHFSRLFKNRMGIAPADWRKLPGEPGGEMSGEIGK